MLALSVKIPSKEDLVEKNFYCLHSKKSPIVQDNSLWGSAIYEVWGTSEVYSSIKQFVEKVDCALYHRDFSEKTTKQLDLTKKLLLEGVRFCGEEKNSLLKPLMDMLDILKRYIQAKEMAKKEKQIETLSNRIVQLQVDIQVSMIDFYDKCYCQQCDDYAEFYKERSEIKKEMKRLEKNVNKEEMRRLRELFRGLKTEFRQYKNLWM